MIIQCIKIVNVFLKKYQLILCLIIICNYVNDFSNIGPGSILRNYRKSFNGFAVKLTEEEARIMAGR